MKIKKNDIPYRNFITKKFKLDKKITQKILQKPFGLWYGIKHYWIMFFTDSKNKLEYDLPKYHLYEIELDKNIFTKLDEKNKDKILKIQTYDEIIDFSKKYGKEMNFKYKLPDWKKVSNDFGGIEISKLIKKAHTTLNYKTGWYCGWDVPSGCIWNYNTIKNINKIL